MSKTSILGKDWILKNYNHETVKFLKDNYNLSEIVSRLIAIRNIKLDEVNQFLNTKDIIEFSVISEFVNGQLT